MKYRFPLLLLMLAFVTGLIHADSVSVGYCSGELTKSGSFSVEGNTDVSGAIYLTPAVLEPYIGTEITALRGALASKVNIDRLTLWVRSELDDTNLAEVTITSSTTPALAKGWIEVTLPETVTIPQGTGLYLGMTYHQKAATKAFSLIGNGFENSFFLQYGNEPWEDRHSEGILSIEAVIEGASAIDYDLALLEAHLDYSSDSEANIVTVRVANNGSEPVTGFSLSFAYGDDTTSEEYYNVVLQPGDKTDVTARIDKVDDVFNTPLIVTLISVDNGDDRIADNNSTTARVMALKKVLLEEFTTEMCSNCPRVAGYIHDMLEEQPYRDRVMVICHHAGFHTDWLTQPCDEEIGWLYGCSSAPAVYFDRAQLPGGNMAETPTPAELRTLVDRRLEVEPGVNISLNSSYDNESRILTVGVTLKRENLTLSDPRLSVFLTENNIAPRHQSGDNEGTFIHQHVIRAYLSTWGERIAWDGSDFIATYSFTLDEGWNPDEMEVVAFVNNYDDTEVTNNVVANVESCRLSTTPSGLPVLSTDTLLLDCRYYDLTGRSTERTASGVIIRVSRYADGTICTEKLLNP